MQSVPCNSNKKMFAFRNETAPVYSVPGVFREAIKNFGTCIQEGASPLSELLVVEHLMILVFVVGGTALVADKLASR